MSSTTITYHGPRQATAPRVGPLVLLAVSAALLIAWALRDHTPYLPSGKRFRLDLLLASGHHGQTGGGHTPPAPIIGEPTLNYTGIYPFHCHFLDHSAFSRWPR